MDMPMTYEISNWKQLKDCYSNNSRKLHIHVSTFTNNAILTGTRIEIDHEDFGVLYSTVIKAEGSLISPYDEDSNIVFEETTSQILAELAKYGFNVVYKPVKHLSKEQIDFLITVKKLGYDKLRILNVWELKRNQRVYHPRIVVFNSDKNPDWLNIQYAPNIRHFNKAALEGSASVVPNSENYDWSWLFDFVANIDDVLDDNAGILGD